MSNIKEQLAKIYTGLVESGFSKDEIEQYALNLFESDWKEFTPVILQLNEGIPLNECGETIATINEKFVKTVNAKGSVKRLKDRKTRERLATITTGLSKLQRRLIARKAAKTKRANPSITRKAQRLRKRALVKRKALGIRN